MDWIDPAWRSVPYGRPLANQRVHVLDHALRPRPDWVPGDLCIAGAGLARGYWRDGERTQDAFVRHPHSGERLYRTGDVCRRLPDGTIEFLGREDDQVKVNGLRIELGEIETALCRAPFVRAAAVVVVRSPTRGDRLAAFVEPAGAGPVDGGGPVDGEALRRGLHAHLPASWVPATIQPVEAIPLTRNGKIDRAALLARLTDAPEPPPVVARPPTDELERRIATLWAELLGAPPTGIGQSFFEAGGTSLLAIRLGSRLGDALGVPIPVLALFEHPTIAGQAAFARRLLGNAPAAPASPTTDAARRGAERRRLQATARTPRATLPVSHES